MSNNQTSEEFLDEVLDDFFTIGTERRVSELKEAILQHFQQEQERARFRVESVKFEFDDRNFNSLEPIENKRGLVSVKFTDGTHAGLPCTRDTLEDSIAKIMNTKLGKPVKELKTYTQSEVDRLTREAVRKEQQTLFDNRCKIIIPPGGHFGWENSGDKDYVVEYINPQTIKGRIDGTHTFLSEPIKWGDANWKGSEELSKQEGSK